MHIVEQTQNRLIIKRDRGIFAIFGGCGQLVFDGDRRKVFADNKVAAWFDDIQAIDIRIHKLGDNDNQFSREVLWKVSLLLVSLKISPLVKLSIKPLLPKSPPKSARYLEKKLLSGPKFS